MKTNLPLSLVAVVLSLSSVGCSPANLNPVPNEGGAGGSSGSGIPGIPGAPGSGPGGSGSQACAQDIEATASKVLVHIALDTSGSMNFADNNGQPRINAARKAVKFVTAKYGDQIKFSFGNYPQPSPGLSSNYDQGACGAGKSCYDMCGAADVSIQPEFNNASAIAAKVDGLTPNGGTPLANTLDAIAQNPNILNEAGYSNHVLLVTDGQETCRPESGLTYRPSNTNYVHEAATTVPTASVTALRQAKNAKVFVAGIGVANDPTYTPDGITALDAMAEAGGTPSFGTPHKYYDANDEAALTQAFDLVAKQALGCSFDLNYAPNNPNSIFVKVNGVFIDREAQHGFSYDPTANRISINGESCRRIGLSQNPKVEIFGGCDFGETGSGGSGAGGNGGPNEGSGGSAGAGGNGGNGGPNEGSGGSGAGGDPNLPPIN